MKEYPTSDDIVPLNDKSKAVERKMKLRKHQQELKDIINDIIAESDIRKVIIHRLLR